MVLSDTLMLRLVVPKQSRGGAYASFDGKGRVELRRGDEVRVEVGRYPFPTVVGEGGTGGEWFESVRRALRWNTRGAVQGGFGSRVNPGDALKEEGVERYGGAHARNDDYGEEGEEGEEEEWDIDADPFLHKGGRGDATAAAAAKNVSADSTLGGASEASSVSASGHTSPLKRGDCWWGLD